MCMYVCIYSYLAVSRIHTALIQMVRMSVCLLSSLSLSPPSTQLSTLYSPSSPNYVCKIRVHNIYSCCAKHILVYLMC